MKVSTAIEALKKLNPDDEIFITWFDKKEFQQEYDEWAYDTEAPPLQLPTEKWVEIVEGTQNDDRIAEAITESMRFDFKVLYDEYEKTLPPEIEQELWDIEGENNVATQKDD